MDDFVQIYSFRLLSIDVLHSIVLKGLSILSVWIEQHGRVCRINEGMKLRLHV